MKGEQLVSVESEQPSEVERIPLIFYSLMSLAWIFEASRLAVFELRGGLPLPIDIILGAAAVGFATYGMLRLVFPLKPRGWEPPRLTAFMIAGTASVASASLLITRSLMGLSPRPGGAFEVLRLGVIILLVLFPVALGLRESELERLVFQRATAFAFLIVALGAFGYYFLEEYAGFPRLAMLWPALLAGVSWITSVAWVSWRFG